MEKSRATNSSRSERKFSGKTNPGGGDILDPGLQGFTAVQMGPERREKYQLACFRGNFDLLVLKLGFTALIVERVQVPDGDQLPLRKFVAAAIDMPMIKLAWVGALNGLAHVLEESREKRVG